MIRTFALIIACGSAVVGCADADPPPEHLRILGGDIESGRRIIRETGCGVCHVIPRIRGARGRVGPSLEFFGARQVIAGRFPNDPDRLSQFVRNAPSIAPETAMPRFNLNEKESRDVAAFLYTLR